MRQATLKEAMKWWNTGLDAEEVAQIHDIDVFEFFKEFDTKQVCKCFTVAELTYGEYGAKFPPREEPEWYKIWSGEIGPGKQLRDIVAEHNAEMSMGE